jgi:hypothetical protein
MAERSAAFTSFQLTKAGSFAIFRVFLQVEVAAA